MVRTYEDWKKNIEFEAKEENISPESAVLRTYISVVEQYLKSPESLACKCVLDSATDCAKKYLGL